MCVCVCDNFPVITKEVNQISVDADGMLVGIEHSEVRVKNESVLFATQAAILDKTPGPVYK